MKLLDFVSKMARQLVNSDLYSHTWGYKECVKPTKEKCSTCDELTCICSVNLQIDKSVVNLQGCVHLNYP